MSQDVKQGHRSPSDGKVLTDKAVLALTSGRGTLLTNVFMIVLRINAIHDQVPTIFFAYRCIAAHCDMHLYYSAGSAATGEAQICSLTIVLNHNIIIIVAEI